MKLFLDSPEKKLHIREIARMTRLSAPGVIKIIKKLKKEHLLLSEKGKIVENVFASRNEKFVAVKKCYNIFHLHDSGFVKFLRNRYEEPEAIVIFGSYSRGEDLSDSDVDIAIITKKRLNTSIADFERILKRKINIHEIQIKHVEKEFLNTLANGIILYGHLRVMM